MKSTWNKKKEALRQTHKIDSIVSGLWGLRTKAYSPTDSYSVDIFFVMHD